MMANVAECRDWIRNEVSFIRKKTSNLSVSLVLFNDTLNLILYEELSTRTQSCPLRLKHNLFNKSLFNFCFILLMVFWGDVSICLYPIELCNVNNQIVKEIFIRQTLGSIEKIITVLHFQIFFRFLIFSWVLVSAVTVLDSIKNSIYIYHP